MKKLLSITLALFTLIFLNSCLKDKGFENQEYGLKNGGILDEPFVQILGGGLSKMPQSNIKPDVTDPLNIADTVTFKIFYVNNGKPADKDIKVTVAVNNAAIAAYNADTTKPDFDRLPDSTFRIGNPIVTVKAGQNFSEDIIVIYNPRKIDNSKLYLLPISIVDAQGVKFSSNNSTIYYNIIGNPLAGNYKSTGFFYHPSSPRVIDIPSKSLLAVTGTQLQMGLGDLSAQVILTVNANNTVTILDKDGVNVGISPTFELTALPAPYSPFPGSNAALYNNTYDPATKTFYLRYGYNGGSGPRTIEEKLVKL